MNDWSRRLLKHVALGILLLMSLPACQPAPEAATPATVAATMTATTQPATITATLPAPVVAIAQSPSPLPDMRSFQLLNPTAQAATAEAAAIALISPTPEQMAIATGDATASPTATLTPQPTFTPPTLPETSANEHYWLIRPIPEGGTVWTDKIYPFGSTRGGTLRPHHGVEFNVPTGTQVLGAASGTVVVAGPDDAEIVGPEGSFYGNVVVIQHDFLYLGQAVFTLYGHLSEVYVAVGQTVAAGELIALSGGTGVADGPHLHFEVRLGANSYDAVRNPLLWLWPFPDRGTVIGRVSWPNGELVAEAPVSLHRVDGPAPYMATTSYASGMLGDPGWGENFAVDDVPAGYYEITVRSGSEDYTVEAWVFSRQTTYVEITLGLQSD
ncbi:MAG: peptidoglycan DD-metalloendopeptidase family protein [Anaerolineales bacterium]|nr:peptidoglycan DD-metalloendopeptidase family protein [Anaerolineales bacterium]